MDTNRRPRILPRPILEPRQRRRRFRCPAPDVKRRTDRPGHKRAHYTAARHGVTAWSTQGAAVRGVKAGRTGRCEAGNRSPCGDPPHDIFASHVCERWRPGWRGFQDNPLINQKHSHSCVIPGAAQSGAPPLSRCRSDRPVHSVFAGVGTAEGQ